MNKKIKVKTPNRQIATGMGVKNSCACCYLVHMIYNFINDVDVLFIVCNMFIMIFKLTFNDKAMLGVS